MIRFLLIISFLTLHGLADDALSFSTQSDQLDVQQALRHQYQTAIYLQGTLPQIQTFTRWLDEIEAVPKGRETLKKISGSGHQLVIEHAAYAVLSAGRTIAPMSSNLINGKGESVKIIFNADIPDMGSHMVYDTAKKLIEYTAIQNLYHELAHAMHMMQGTWRYFKPERQAIEEENVFRRELAVMTGKPLFIRVRKSGKPIIDLESAISGRNRSGHDSKTQKPVAPRESVSSAGVVSQQRTIGR